MWMTIQTFMQILYLNPKVGDLINFHDFQGFFNTTSSMENHGIKKKIQNHKSAIAS